MGRSVMVFLERVTVKEEGEVGCTVTQAEERGRIEGKGANPLRAIILPPLLPD